MIVPIPSPAISIVGRHNSGKTTRIVSLITELVARGYDIGSIKHHSHVGFEIDYPGKDSYRHRKAGASETMIASPGQIASIKTIQGEMECNELLRLMPGHDLVIVEGYRKSFLPTIEIMRSGNDADSRVAAVFAEGAEKGWPLGTDFTQMTRGIVHIDEVDEEELALASSARGAGIPMSVVQKFTVHSPDPVDISNKLPTAQTVAVVTDIAEAYQAAKAYGIAAFTLDDTCGLADFVEAHYVRPRLSVVIQAGGESRRMGISKATVPFAGRPLICRLIERLRFIADELIITTNEAEHLAFLKEEFPSLDIKFVADVYPYRGALPGLYTALHAASHSFVSVVACDMVFASPALVVAEALTMKESGADVVVPVNQHGFEPFHATYRRENCLAAIEGVLARGEKRAQAFFPEVEVFEFSQTRVLEAEPMGGCFINVNTPEELKLLEESFLDS
ncbi:MAG: molybdopterin-guanine dinucleotide biosynthesis protein B [Eggerthellaceae bacterium]|nr:molybdopterin-guanine dinucleotide biosynthesis protein B [Eggerthellaceae bacterium]